MSYALRGLGTFEPWVVMAAHTLDSTEVYVLRLPCSGLPLKDGADLLLFARAAGQGQNMNLDVRSVGATGTGDAWSIDVVMTSSFWQTPTPFVATDATAMAKNVAADEQVRAAFPKLVIDFDKAQFGELTGPKDAVDTWLSQPFLWDHTLPGSKGRGGPTATFAKPTDLSLFKGQADDGRAAANWGVTIPPVGPDNRPDSSSNVGWYIVGGAAVLGVGLAIWSRSRKR